MSAKKTPIADRSLTPAPTKESRGHSADLPGASETKKTIDSQKKAVPSNTTKGR